MPSKMARLLIPHSLRTLYRRITQRGYGTKRDFARETDEDLAPPVERAERGMLRFRLASGQVKERWQEVAFASNLVDPKAIDKADGVVREGCERADDERFRRCWPGCRRHRGRDRTVYRSR